MKKILLTLFVGFIGITSFCNAKDDIILSGSKLDFKSNSEFRSISSVYIDNDNFFYHATDLGYNELRIYNDLGEDILVCLTNLDTTTFNGAYGRYSFTLNGGNGNQICFLMYGDLDWYGPIYGNNFDISANIILKKSTINTNYCLENNLCPTCPEVDTGAILSGYVSESQLNSCNSNLNSCQSDLDSCQSNTTGFNDLLNNCNLSLNACNSSLTSCLQYNCPETELSYSKFYVKHGESEWSQLNGTEFYYVYLPDYLGFNYDYSNDGRDLDFTVGVATDTGYINNINAIQNSKPSQEDLNKLISEVIPLFVPGLAIILLLYFIFRFIKKVF